MTANMSVRPVPIQIKKRPIVPFWCGGVAAMTASCFTHPLDLIKVHLQTSTSRKSALHALRTVLTDRGLLGLYNGLSAALLRQGTYTMTRFAVYDLAKEQLSSNGKKSLGPWQVVVATVLSGVAGGIVGNPGEIVNVRMQNDQALPTKLQRNYKSAVHGLVNMVKTEGIGALMIGVGPSLVRATLATGSQFVSYDIVKAKMMAEGCEDSVGVHFAASFLAGIVATTVCSPADVVKSRMMALVRTEGAKIPGLWQTCRSIYANEGARAFFKGWVPSYVRLCPQLVITFVIYEKLRKSYFAHYKS